ncbi:hypothetical protein [Curtobacterium sp. VKM Ac-1395]|uniref:hypothetical protein n=1 Tax=Curtobacterium sp. VKM Ac-1395 TaxID=2783815 RepID=UPI00188BB008|nr:hypothetical protein [Curtobacterium sp. VKM Ac-1395]MBF4590433.1 hypothetical protein [Curtobacterium sp. VKM Ac-1395]
MDSRSTGNSAGAASSRIGLIREHFRTLRHHRTNQLLWPDFLLQLPLPVVLGAASWWFDARINDASAIVGGASVLSGFLFGVVIYVFQMRQSLSHDPRVQRQALLPRLVDELFANVLYAVVVSFVLTGAALVTAATQEHTKQGVLIPTPPWITGALVLVAVHLFAVVWMCVKRLRSSYRELKDEAHLQNGAEGR